MLDETTGSEKADASRVPDRGEEAKAFGPFLDFFWEVLFPSVYLVIDNLSNQDW